MDLKALVGALSQTCRRAFEVAAQEARGAGHADLTAAHLLKALVSDPESELTRVLAHLGIEIGHELDERLDGYARGAGQLPVPSVELHQLLRKAWHVRGLMGRSAISSGAILAALTDVEEARRVARLSAPTLLTIPRGGVLKILAEMRALEEAGDDPPGQATREPAPTAEAAPQVPALARYTSDLTARAEAGEIDPIVGRDTEIRRLVDILSRRRQNNPLLVGDAGVGKTAVVEGLALRIAAGEVPPGLRQVRVLALDLGLLRAGASYQGEFEERLRGVVSAVTGADPPIVLFIDEAHALIGAGGRTGTGDAANLLKPALARGDLRTIAATTWKEYKRHVERDPALARRFQAVRVDEPVPAVAEAMLRALVPRLAAHHEVPILDEAVIAAVRLSQRYVSGRRLPDKAVSVLDTACARVSVARVATPAPIERLRARRDHLEGEIALLTGEAGAGIDHGPRLAELYAGLDRVSDELVDLTRRWERERSLVDQLLRLDDGGPEVEEERRRIKEGLAAEGPPLVPARVDARAVAEVIEDWTGVPTSQMVHDHASAALDLRTRLTDRVVGQGPAVECVARRLLTASADLAPRERPTAVLLLAGPTGVGKTETARALAEALYGGEPGLVTINMSEFQEAHSVAGLKGAPPGYVGFGEGGVLTEAVRRRPYSLVLLDEVEKAHPDVLDLFYQVFDKGRLDDAEGIPVDFRNTLIVLTTNVGAETLRARTGGPRGPSVASLEELQAAIRPALETRFPRALLARLTVVPYLSLGTGALASVARLELSSVAVRVRESAGAELIVGDALVESLARASADAPDGARAVHRLIADRVLPALSSALLDHRRRGGPLAAVRLAGSAEEVEVLLGRDGVPAEPPPRPAGPPDPPTATRLPADRLPRWTEPTRGPEPARRDLAKDRQHIPSASVEAVVPSLGSTHPASPSHSEVALTVRSEEASTTGAGWRRWLRGMMRGLTGLLSRTGPPADLSKPTRDE